MITVNQSLLIFHNETQLKMWTHEVFIFQNDLNLNGYSHIYTPQNALNYSLSS